MDGSQDEEDATTDAAALEGDVLEVPAKAKLGEDDHERADAGNGEERGSAMLADSAEGREAGGKGEREEDAHHVKADDDVGGRETHETEDEGHRAEDEECDATHDAHDLEQFVERGRLDR